MPPTALTICRFQQTVDTAELRMARAAWQVQDVLLQPLTRAKTKAHPALPGCRWVPDEQCPVLLCPGIS